MTRPKVFVDSSFWLAFFNQEDALYPQALSFARDKKFLEAILFTSDHILDETLTRLRRKVGAEAAFRFFENLWKQIREGNLTLLFTKRENFHRAYRIFKNNPRPKSFSFTDATVVALLKAHKIKSLLSFDRDFRKIKPKVSLLP